MPTTITTDAEYRSWYTKGWTYSGRPTATLDHGDSHGYPEAWYDGYLDRAAGRAKWSTRTEVVSTPPSPRTLSEVQPGDVLVYGAYGPCVVSAVRSFDGGWNAKVPLVHVEFTCGLGFTAAADRPAVTA